MELIGHEMLIYPVLEVHQCDHPLTKFFSITLLLCQWWFRAANLWVWNAARAEFSHAPFKPGREPQNGASTDYRQVVATFRNTGKDRRFDDAELYYDEDGFFGSLAAHKEVRVNTFRTHVWNIKSKSTRETLHTFVIEDDTVNEQIFEV